MNETADHKPSLTEHPRKLTAAQYALLVVAVLVHSLTLVLELKRKYDCVYACSEWWTHDRRPLSVGNPCKVAVAVCLVDGCCLGELSHGTAEIVVNGRAPDSVCLVVTTAMLRENLQLESPLGPHRQLYRLLRRRNMTFNGKSRH